VKYYVYIIYSQSKDKYYTGYAVNPVERVMEHNLGATPSTRTGRPWALAYMEEFEDKRVAIKRERAIKHMKSHKYLKTIFESKRPD